MRILINILNELKNFYYYFIIINIINYYYYFYYINLFFNLNLKIINELR